MAETPATRSSLQRTPPPSLPYKLEIDQLKRRLALVAGGTDAAELTALLAAREDDVARLCQENAQLRQGAPPPPPPDSDAEAALELLEGELATEQAARERAEHELAALRTSSGDLESERAARERAEHELAALRASSGELDAERAARARPRRPPPDAALAQLGGAGKVNLLDQVPQRAEGIAAAVHRQRRGLLGFGFGCRRRDVRSTRPRSRSYSVHDFRPDLPALPEAIVGLARAEREQDAQDASAQLKWGPEVQVVCFQ